MNSDAYHSNCFLYASRQAKVSDDVTNYIKTHISDTHIKTKDVGTISEKFWLGFVPYEAHGRPSTKQVWTGGIDEIKNGYIAGDPNYPNPIQPLIFKYHWMLYEDDILYNNEKYNTYRLLEAFIKGRILKPMTVDVNLLVKSKCEAYFETTLR